MNPDYPDKLRDLGLTEQQIESILDLNAEAYYAGEDYAWANTSDGDWPYLSKIEYFLQTEGFIK